MKSKWIYIFFIMVMRSIICSDCFYETKRVTVFVHGTHLIMQKLGLALGMNATVNHENGLYSLQNASQEYRYTKVAHNIAQCASDYFPKEDIYLFCWSGKLSHEARIIAAQELNETLNNLVLKYEKKCVITLVTHSHGGNVALNLASIAGPREYEIDSLILLAVPVQYSTCHHVDNSLFKTVISLYSRWDITQVGDPQGWTHKSEMFYRMFELSDKIEGENRAYSIPLFSQRVFPSEKVKHIEVRQTTLAGYRPLGHIEFLRPHVIGSLTAILREVELYDFSICPMIFNIPRSFFYDVYFGNP
jgi:hypothetical protein